MADPYIIEDVLCRSDIYKYLEDKAFSSFLNHAVNTNEITFVSLTLPIPTIDPLILLENLSRPGDFQFFWEIAQDDLSIAAGKALLTIKGHGQARFQQVRNEVKHVLDQTLEYSALPYKYSGLNFLGGFSFDEKITDPAWEAFGAASFFVPEWMVIKDKHRCFITFTLDVSAFHSAMQLKNEIKSRIQEITGQIPVVSEKSWDNTTEYGNVQKLSFNQSSNAYRQWTGSVEKAKEHIKTKRFDKIVLAREHQIEVQNQLSPIHIINDLRKEYPNCYSFLIGWHGSKNFIGSSPERLAAFKKDMLLTEALAGSIQRGLTVPEDAALEKQLLKSSKDMEEHNFVIKAIEQNLDHIASDIKRQTTPVIKKFANVQHLFTPITAYIDDSQDRISVLQNLHPTPAVGGYPWKAASDYITELEDFSRGWYSGPIGWLNSKGDGEFTVAIRSGLIENDTARFYAGCGIVEDSDPDAEWRETSLKLIPMLSALRYD